MPLPRRPKTNKNPPIFSHEFVIQNHADIVSCVAMVFVIGLMFQATNPVASLFVAMQHNVTVNETEDVMSEVTHYTYGLKDMFAVFFYLLICIVIHAVIQEYILDKVNRRMHLSKVKHSKFNESGQLMAFYAVSAFWSADIIIRENYLPGIANLWQNYPHANMQFITKFYFIIQLAYWVHNFPELYFQKVKKEEMSSRVQYTLLYLAFISAAYLLNFSRIALCLLLLHYSVEFIFHLSRLLYFAEKSEIANTGFMVWNVVFVLVRLATITLAVLTFWYGLEQSSASAISFSEGNFNTQIIRINCLAAACLLQAWMMWNFITFHLRRRRESAQAATAATKKLNQQLTAAPKRRERKTKGRKGEDDTDENGREDSPAENGTVRQRTPKAKRQ